MEKLVWEMQRPCDMALQYFYRISPVREQHPAALTKLCQNLISAQNVECSMKTVAQILYTTAWGERNIHKTGLNFLLLCGHCHHHYDLNSS